MTVPHVNMNRRQAIVWNLLEQADPVNSAELHSYREWAADLLGITKERVMELETEAAERIAYDFKILEDNPELDP